MPRPQYVVRRGVLTTAGPSQPPLSVLLGESPGVCNSHFNIHTHMTLGKSSTSCFLFCTGVVPALLGPPYGMDRGTVTLGTHTTSMCFQEGLNRVKSWDDGPVGNMLATQA